MKSIVECIAENLGAVVGCLGIMMIALGFVIGAFMLHWILGLIVSGIAFIVIGSLLCDNNFEEE